MHTNLEIEFVNTFREKNIDLKLASWVGNVLVLGCGGVDHIRKVRSLMKSLGYKLGPMYLSAIDSTWNTIIYIGE
jgi:hypothetical protein